MVVGICSLLLYGTGTFQYAVIYIKKKKKKKKSGIDKLDGKVNDTGMS